MQQVTGLDLDFSLLWPKGRGSEGASLNGECINDLGVDRLIEALIIDKSRHDALRTILMDICHSPQTLGYRLDVIDDLLGHQPLVECLQNIAPVLSELRYFVMRPDRDDKTPLHDVVWRLRELEHYVECVIRFSEAFRGSEGILQSEGLIRLSRLIGMIESDPTFGRLQKVLPGLLSSINRLKSITIGVNLNGALEPCEATLLSIDSTAFKDGSLFGRIIGRDEQRGITPLHTTLGGDFAANPLMDPLFRDVATVMNKITRPLAQALKEFTGINGRLFIKLQDEFLFYLGAVHMIRDLRAAGLPMTRPKIEAKESRLFQAADLYNINLALFEKQKRPGTDLTQHIVTNDFSLDDDGRIVVLTGPNRGGKTTLLQAIGLAQILMQVGMYVPASDARLSIAETVLTHYPALEELEKGTGRFGEEAQRLKRLFHNADRFSLILLNETFASTNSGESLYLAQDLLGVFRMMGCRVVFTTHIHQLAAEVESLNREFQGDSRLISMVATIIEEAEEEGVRIRPTFRILPGPPAGHSYARELASKFGISKEKLLADLKDRGELLPVG